MLALFNGQERTITALRNVLNQAGWKLIAAHHDAPSVARFERAIGVPNSELGWVCCSNFFVTADEAQVF